MDDKNIQLYEILPVFDALITDYSSVAIDYLLIDKPIGFTLDDFEEYRKSRGFVFNDPREYMPGEHIYVLDDLIKFISNVANGKDEYKDKRDELKRIAHNPAQNYCDRILEHFGLK